MPSQTVSGTKAGLSSLGANDIRSSPNSPGGYTGRVSSGGGGNQTNSNNNNNQPKPKDQVFECIGRGLKPDTVHKFYYENVDRTKDCRQLGTNNNSTRDDGRLGGPLKTDASGYVRFYFYFTAAVEKEVDALNKVRYNLIGDKVFELRAVDSTAKKVVPFSLNTRR
jgi:hypothetical protein